MQTLVVLVGTVLGLAIAALPNIGPCSVNVETAPNFNLDKFSSENNGIWSFKLVPNTKFFDPINWMFWFSNPISDSGVYQTQIFFNNGKEPDIDNQLILFDTHDGVINAAPIYGNTTSTYNFFFLDYEPGSYAYYYVCSDDGADTDIDYRFVLSHGKLSAGQKSKIKELESDFQFKGTLRYLVENNN